MNDAVQTATEFPGWFDSDGLEQLFGSAGTPLIRCKQFLKDAHDLLQHRFEEGAPVTDLVQARAWLVDRILQRTWKRFLADDGGQPALVAVGGYGRSELMPGSDIDLLLLLPENAGNRYDERLTALVTFLWDIGLEVGHSVRSIADCVEQSLADITVITNLIEARLLAGNAELFRAMQAATAADRIWNSREYFEAKLAEQHARYAKYHGSGYNLEPNIKEGPGGLRDIQMINWVASRHLGTTFLEQLVDHGFLTRKEYLSLIAGRNLLWRIRFALHTLTGRGEDRLLFDHQRTLAEQFGFRNDENRLGVEAFMEQYYRTIMELSRLNEMLLQLLHEEILYPEGPGEPLAINRRFQSRNGYLEVSHPNTFRYQPFAMLEIFLLLQQHPELKGVRADTIRALREHNDLINDEFRRDIRCRSLFMEIFRQPQGLTHALRRMNVYGVLAAYLPVFRHIVGLMQYDLFHIYTVDEHIINVIRNLRRFSIREHSSEFPLCSHIHDTIPKPELLYLAGLFHDIAKGRGGDHSELGAVDAREFCLAHGLSEFDTRLVSWLVENHLIMSSTAQRQDIDDPEVINRFAASVRDTMYLDYLYLLTVADIRATNPQLWNNWKDALLKQLYYNARRALQRGLQNPLVHADMVTRMQEAALELLDGDAEHFRPLWERLGNEYFLRHLPWQIARHTRLLEQLGDAGASIVTIDSVSERGGTEIFIYTRSSDYLFSRVTAVLARMGLDVVDAGIITTSDNHVLDTFHVLDDKGKPLENDLQMQEVRDALLAALEEPHDHAWHVSRRTPREYRHFRINTHISFRQDEHNRRTIMELVTSDRPGLLSRVGRAFGDCHIRLWNAKIATLGERAEDVYYITDLDNNPLSEDSQFDCLRNTLTHYLDEMDESAGDSAVYDI